MDFTLDTNSDVPLFLQIIEWIQNGVATGVLRPGQQLPTVRAIAIQLGVNPGTVAKAYSELEREGVIATHRGGGSYVATKADSDRLAIVRENRLWSIIGKAAVEALSRGYTPQEIEAAFILHMARWREAREKGESGEIIAKLAEKQNTIVLTGSHDVALELLASHLRRRDASVTLAVTNVGSLGGLIALERDEAHIAGAHLLDEETGQYNVPFVKRFLPGQEVVLITLAHRLQGLMVASGNPKDINGLEDLRRKGVRFINRQRGAGTRVLLDYKLRQLRIAPDEIMGYERETDTHIAVAAAIAGGTADVGLGIYSAARALGLGFVPLLKERYDLVIPRHHYDSEFLKPLVEVVSDGEFKQAMMALGGYDTIATGKITIVGA